MSNAIAQLDDLGFFVAVVEAGGFSAAARALGARKAQVSRRVAGLERELGARLLERTTRAVRLTDTGAEVYERAARAVALAKQAREVVLTRRVEPSGTLRVSATELLAELLLRPVTLGFLRKYPRVSVEVDVTSRPVDLLRDGFDLALRVGAPTDSSLVGRVLGKGRAIYVAAPGFLRAAGRITQPKDLRSVDAIVISSAPPAWRFQRGRARQSVRPQVRLSTASYALSREAALAGLGVALLPSYYVAAEVRSGRLEQVLAAWTPPEASVTAVYASRELVAPKVRAFVDLLAAHVARRPLFESEG